MKYKYGTSGFRFKIPLILEASPNIAKTVCLLSSQKDNYLGIMITASHNDYTYNGVKIVDVSGELLSSQDEEFCVKSVNSDLYLELKNRNSKIIIGHDTRPSSLTIKDILIKTLQTIDSNCSIIDIGLCTTPQLHYHVFKENHQIAQDYYEYYFEFLDSFRFIPYNVYVDCANGAGTGSMLSILKWKSLSNIRLTNTYTNSPHLLNHQCGSDFICSSKTFPTNLQKYSKKDLYASFDGDADRVVFYFEENKNFCLLDGDRIISLIVYYLSQILPLGEVNVGVVHTAYSNGNFIKYLQQQNVETECVATGVKHLHKAALKYEIGIYFESNGHGTILIKESICQTYPELVFLKKICNQLIGDAISDFFIVLTILNNLSITPQTWFGLYEQKPSLISKVSINNQSNVFFETSPDESKLIKPQRLQTNLEHLIKEYPECFVFIRPSGTENCLRYYIECQDHSLIPEIEKKVLFFIQSTFS